MIRQLLFNLAWKELPRVAQRTGDAIVRRPIPLRGVINATGNQSQPKCPPTRAFCTATRHARPNATARRSGSTRTSP
ncbi:hypothetical protein CBM2589_A70281 [Cupriavidus taiwanensis]|uniref:Uncharacterized protein n=1 Tax=Cupriavidus taiwanensis TaxID=164546 RepID=A0A975XAX7_9BURK|nr:hypothetical protein CBM2589_A70281 [Cupriavidus taiwanensis]